MQTNDLQPTLRKATTADAAAITALTEAAYAKYIPLIGRKPQPMTADYSQMVVEHPVWLLEVAEQLGGVLVLIEEPETLLIYSIAVRPDLQGCGLGHRLLTLAENEARQAGCQKIRLYTNAHFVENIELYQRAGYQQTRREEYLGSRLVHMAKRLEPLSQVTQNVETQDKMN